MSRKRRLLALAMLPLAAQAVAEDKPLWEFGLGAASLSFPAYRGSDQRRNFLLPVPYVIYRGEVQSWVNELRDPAHWVAGCIAVDEAGQQWQAIAGNEASGALMWLPLGNPDK